ncbi:hypothetical protein MX659_07115 [Coriobacteriia bacterium Es71-Z0120]|uniref:hypothetical protein n=1 Tax=Parvivirga hydrogeniphila TaxID=2939460 RepID=UPI002260D503|nr:hypothetical protein [Parvivirga hydrogeniphila]MCL4079351.1 hypothetical protein [Parvivirga hydrogeniphila]
MINIDIMQCRLAELAATYQGLLRTGMPLVAYRNGALAPAGFSDDPGLYLIVPWIARILRLDVYSAYQVFVVFLIAVAAVVGVLGLFRLTRSTLARLYALGVAAVLCLGAFKIADVYTVCFAYAFAFVPWLLVRLRDRASDWRTVLFMVALGALGAASHLVRSQSATSMVLFAVILVVFWLKDGWKKKLAALLALAIGAAVVLAGFSALLDRRESYLAVHVAGYRSMPVGHPFWHSAYIGLAYLPNPYVSAWDDSVAARKAAELAPDAPYLSREYEAALRSEVLRIVRTDPVFVVRTVAAKLATEVFRALLLVGLGLVALIRRRPPAAVVAAFAAAVAFEMLPALLTMPFHPYMLGLYTWSATFGIVCVVVALDDRVSQRQASGTPSGSQAGS